MKPSQVLESHRADIRRIVAAHRAQNASVFGSVVHGEDTEDSDLDIEQWKKSKVSTTSLVASMRVPPLGR